MNAVSTRRVPIFLAFMVAVLFALVPALPARATQTTLTVTLSAGGSWTFPTLFVNHQNSYVSLYDNNSAFTWSLRRQTTTAAFAWLTNMKYHQWTNFCKSTSSAACNNLANLQIGAGGFFVIVHSGQGVVDTVSSPFRWDVPV